MPASLTAVPRVALGFLLIVLNTIVHTLPLFALALAKFVLPIAVVRKALSHALVVIAESWIAVNSALLIALARVTIHLEGVDGLRRDGWYLVVSNHQSWVDIPILQSIFNRRIPFLRFFIKSQLIWVPVLGLAWWALDFPFMKRYSKEFLARHPELRGKDIEATRKACEKYRDLPVSVMNFVEGTRFTPAKHARQPKLFEHVLLPRAGGVALVLEAMGERLDAVVDVTLVYPRGRPSVVDLLSARVRDVHAHVRSLPIPAELLGGDYAGDAAFRDAFQAWLNGIWADKDARIAAHRAAQTGTLRGA